MELGLKGKVALITGPAKGMGASITLAFAGEGCKLVLAGRDMSAIEPLAKQLMDLRTEVIVQACDVTNASDCKKTVAAGISRFGCVDILVNVAGGTGPIGKTGVETSPEEFDEIVSLNLGGCFHMIRAVAPAMIANRQGKIVNVGGTFGMRGRAGRVSYSASKWGLRGLTKSFALELGSDNINVNYVAPGMVDGPAFGKKSVGTWHAIWAFPKKKLPVFIAKIMRLVGSPRMSMSPMPAYSWPAMCHARLPEPIYPSMAAGRRCDEIKDALNERKS